MLGLESFIPGNVRNFFRGGFFWGFFCVLWELGWEVTHVALLYTNLVMAAIKKYKHRSIISINEKMKEQGQPKCILSL